MRDYESAHGYKDGENLGFDTEALFPLYTVLEERYDIVETTPSGSRKIRLRCELCSLDRQFTEQRFMLMLYGFHEAAPIKPLHPIDIACIPG
ncbi:hypothetical protein [Nocardiopsis dassonvillei]|uniref:hypothetical protein n=1 Tax=Nocardiopsis dassonvillei TaxID=2014 RepID=UPI003F578A66